MSPEAEHIEKLGHWRVSTSPTGSLRMKKARNIGPAVIQALSFGALWSAPLLALSSPEAELVLALLVAGSLGLLGHVVWVVFTGGAPGVVDVVRHGFSVEQAESRGYREPSTPTKVVADGRVIEAEHIQDVQVRVITSRHQTREMVDYFLFVILEDRAYQLDRGPVSAPLIDIQRKLRRALQSHRAAGLPQYMGTMNNHLGPMIAVLLLASAYVGLVPLGGMFLAGESPLGVAITAACCMAAGQGTRWLLQKASYSALATYFRAELGLRGK